MFADDLDDLKDLLLDLVSSPLFQQVFPLVVLVVVPLFVLGLVKTVQATFSSPVWSRAGMVLDWLFSSSSSSPSSPHDSTSGTGQRKRRTHGSKSTLAGGTSRGKGQDMALTALGKGKGAEVDEPPNGYYPGLVNISGTYCFMNSTVQALSSLAYLQPQIDLIQSKAEALDVPTPVIDALQDLFHRINTPRSSPSAIRPLDLISVLSNPTPSSSGSRSGNSLFNSREHQDAQELFQLLSECIKTESSNIAKEAGRDRGFGGLAPMISSGTLEDSDNGKDMVPGLGKSVFDGLTANRRSCVVCGYTEAVMHFAFDSWQLAVPGIGASCLLEQCLEDYTRLEVLKDCVCQRCSVNATYIRLGRECVAFSDSIAAAHAAAVSAGKEKSSSVKAKEKERKKKLRDMKTTMTLVKAALDEGRIEDEIPGVKLDRNVSGMSTKQAMIARPPPVLALHLNRSMHFSHYATKNNIQVVFPEVLDLSPYTTSGNLSTTPTQSLSSQSSPLTPKPAAGDADIHSRTLYRLSAVVCHYGAHSFGHYVCFRRKPTTDATGWKPPKLVYDPRQAKKHRQPLDEYGIVDWVWSDSLNAGRKASNTGWLKVSDNAVYECGIEAVLQEGSGAFMLYYERVVVEQPLQQAAPAPANTLSPSQIQSALPNGVNGSYPYSNPTTGLGIRKGAYESSSLSSSQETLMPGMIVTANGHGSASADSDPLKGSQSLGRTADLSTSLNDKRMLPPEPESTTGPLLSRPSPLLAQLPSEPPSGPSGSSASSGQRAIPRIVRNVSTSSRERTPSLLSKVNASNMVNGHADKMDMDMAASPAPAPIPADPPKRSKPPPETAVDMKPHNHTPETNIKEREVVR